MMGYQPKYDLCGNKRPTPRMTRRDWIAVALIAALVLAFLYGLWTALGVLLPAIDARGST